jgi:hypothetical protein
MSMTGGGPVTSESEFCNDHRGKRGERSVLVL